MKYIQIAIALTTEFYIASFLSENRHLQITLPFWMGNTVQFLSEHKSLGRNRLFFAFLVTFLVSVSRKQRKPIHHIRTVLIWPLHVEKITRQRHLQIRMVLKSYLYRFMVFYQQTFMVVKVRIATSFRWW